MKRVLVISLAAVLALCLSVVPLPSQTAMAGGVFNVPSNYLTIQAGIDAAFIAGGGTVLVAANTTYNENIQLESGVNVVSDRTGDAIISSTSIYPVVTANEVTNAKLDGFTITNGSGSGTQLGAGVSIQANSSNVTISNCVITGNTAYLRGGGIAIDHSSATIVNCTIVGNTANKINEHGGTGGGIYISNSSPIIINCISANNTALNAGGGIYVDNSPSANITHNDVWQNSPNDYGGTANQTGINGNISKDPLFENPSGGDYHLQSGSPCIDTGDNSAPNLPDKDKDGNDRKINGTVDMGAYEYQLTNSPPVADAGPDQTVEQTSYEGAEVTLDGTASSDPDDDPLTFSWSAQDISFDDATSSTPTATFPLGTTTVTLMVNDGTVDSDPDTMMVAVLSLHSIKTQAILELESLLPTGEKKVDKKIEKAIEHLEKALDEALWLDDTHLDEKHGAKVFNEEKKTVKELKHLLDKDDTPEGVKDICQSVINKLIEVDKLLATTAYEEAQSGAGYPKVDKELEKCDKELEKAEEELAKGKYDKAIKHYKNAWKHAQKALGKAPEDDE